MSLLLINFYAADGRWKANVTASADTLRVGRSIDSCERVYAACVCDSGLSIHGHSPTAAAVSPPHQDIDASAENVPKCVGVEVRRSDTFL